MTNSLDEPLQIECARVKRKTLLFISKTAGFGGVEKHLIELVTRLDRLSVRQTILCAKGDPYTQRLPPQANVVVHHCKKPPSSLLGWTLLFRRFRPDILVFVDGGLGVFDWRHYAAAHLARIRQVVAIQHLVPLPLPPEPPCTLPIGIIRRSAGWRARFLLSQRIAAFFCDRVICVSDAVRDSLIRDYSYKADRLITIHNGIDTNTFAQSDTVRAFLRNKKQIGQDEVVFICAARLAPVKGIDVLLDALALVQRDGCHFRCLIVGEGESRQELELKIHTLQLDDVVSLEGFQPNVLPYLQLSDIFVLTSWQEGLPLAILEAMACGLPCVVTDVGGNREAVTNNVDGFLVPAGNTAAIADAIKYLIRNTTDRVKMAKLARAKMVRDFDLHRSMDHIAEEIVGSAMAR